MTSSVFGKINMKELTLRKFIFKEVLSVDLEEISDTSGTRYEVNVYTLNDEQEPQNLVYKFEAQSLGVALSTFKNKVNMLTGLVS